MRHFSLINWRSARHSPDSYNEARRSPTQWTSSAWLSIAVRSLHLAENFLACFFDGFLHVIAGDFVFLCPFDDLDGAGRDARELMHEHGVE